MVRGGKAAVCSTNGGAKRLVVFSVRAEIGGSETLASARDERDVPRMHRSCMTLFTTSLHARHLGMDVEFKADLREARVGVQVRE